MNPTGMETRLIRASRKVFPMDFTKEEIIERFFRGDKQRSSEGNGLGLAIVSTYVKALGGEFDIKIDCDQFKACVEMPLSAITIT